MAPRDWKSCGELTPQDFERYSVWGFDLERAGSDPDADETWVRPMNFPKLPRDTDVLFIRAEIRTAAGALIPGALTVRYESGKPKTEGLVLLKPEYACVSFDGNKVVPRDKQDLKRLKPHSSNWFPLSYRATLVVGKRSVSFEGTVR